jgi:glucan 1,3-beta-glucosidase
MAGSNNGALSVGSVVIIDSNFFNTPVGISTGRDDNPNPPSDTSTAPNSLILENVNFVNVATAIQGPGGSVVLAGGVVHVDAWGQGNSYTSSGAEGFFQRGFAPNTRPASLVSGQDYYERSKPQYEMIGAPGFFSIKDLGARGDGVTDDSDAIMNILNTAVNSGSIVYWDAGTYLVTKTIRVPPGIRIFGEAYPVIMSSGSFFADASNPKPVVQIGRAGESGSVEISNLIVSGKGAQAGAIFIEYNLNSVRGSGLWDVHTRVGGFAGSDLLVAQCAKAPGDDRIKPECIAGFMSMHITPSATGVYMENNWLWVADHDIEDPALSQITIYAGRGLLVQSTFGGNWLYGTAVEHHQLYEYNLASTRDIVMGQIQTETAYWQPTPNGPYAVSAAWNDPIVNNVGAGWGLNIKNSRVLIYGAGLYSFFDNYDVTCSNQGNESKCQRQIFNVEGTSQVSVYNLNTVGSDSMIALAGFSIASWADNQNGFVSTIALFRNTGGSAP